MAALSGTRSPPICLLVAVGSHRLASARSAIHASMSLSLQATAPGESRIARGNLPARSRREMVVSESAMRARTAGLRRSRVGSYGVSRVFICTKNTRPMGHQRGWRPSFWGDSGVGDRSAWRAPPPDGDCPSCRIRRQGCARSPGCCGPGALSAGGRMLRVDAYPLVSSRPLSHGRQSGRS